MDSKFLMTSAIIDFRLKKLLAIVDKDFSWRNVIVCKTKRWTLLYSPGGRCVFDFSSLSNYDSCSENINDYQVFTSKQLPTFEYEQQQLTSAGML